MFIVRFDLRNPDWTGRDTAELYAQAVDMTAYAEANGAMMAVISEHHAAPDGHLASPIVLASAMAAQLKKVTGVQIPNSQSRSRTPTTVALGGVAFDSLGTGTTQVSATAAGQAGVVAGPTVTVTVDTPGITLFSLPATIGGGLQVNGFRVRLGAPAPAGAGCHQS